MIRHCTTPRGHKYEVHPKGIVYHKESNIHVGGTQYETVHNTYKFPRWMYSGHNENKKPESVSIDTTEAPDAAAMWARDNVRKHGGKPFVYVINTEKALSGGIEHLQSSRPTHRFTKLPPGSYVAVEAPPKERHWELDVLVKKAKKRLE